MRKAALLFLVLSLKPPPVRPQDSRALGGISSFGISSTYSPDSSHIFIGASEHRRTWTLGAEFTHRLYLAPWYRIDYEGSILPLYEETDPTVLGTVFTLNGQTFNTPQDPVRVVAVANGPVGTAIGPNHATAPIYALFGRQDTYAAAISPLGAKISAFPRSHIQPTFALDLGFVVSARDIPIDQSAQFNYMFSFGPGFEVYATSQSSWRFEYIYRHISNAGQGAQNPGVDQGVARVTVSFHK